MTDERRPRLAYVVNTLNAGGTERLVVEMSRAFAAEFEVEVYCLDEPGIWAGALRGEGITVHSLWRQPGLDSSLPKKIARLTQHRDVSILHAHQCTAWFYAALSRLHHRAPKLLLEEHGRFYPEVDRPRRRWVNRHLIRHLTHRFIAVSDDIRHRLQRYEGLDLAQIELIYNGVAPIEPLGAEARRTIRAELGFQEHDFLVGTVGRLDPIKNLPMLIDALGAAGVQCPQVRGLLIGDGPEFGAVRARVAAAGLDRRIHLAGFREDARTLVQCLDMFVLSSLSEGTSMALLEAMSVGLPVAVTAVGGNPEIVQAGRTGWVVPSGGVSDLSAALVEAATQPQRRMALAQAGQVRYFEQFTFERMIARYREVYRELLAAPA